MPERHTLILNRQNLVVQALLNEEDGEKKNLIAAQLYDLARMSTRPLEKEEITAFLKRSHKLLGMVK
jgi:molecular chaperone HtpG